MNSNTLNLGVLSLMSAALGVFPSCKSEPDIEETQHYYYDDYDGTMTTTDTYYETSKHGTIKSTDEIWQSTTPSRGVVSVETYQVTANVTSIDSMSRKITLTTTDGKMRTIKAGPDVVNFDQIHVGDKVVATLTKEVAVFLSEQGMPPSAGQTTTVTVAPVGGKPGGIVTETMNVTAEVVAVNAQSRDVTLRFPDSTTREIKVGSEISLAGVEPGDDVHVRVTEALAIDVRKSN